MQCSERARGSRRNRRVARRGRRRRRRRWSASTRTIPSRFGSIDSVDVDPELLQLFPHASRAFFQRHDIAMCSLLVRASQSSEISARFGRYRDAAAVRDAYRLVTQIFLVRHVDTRLTRARVVRFASNLSLSSARVDRRSIDRSMISLRARDARSLDERMRGYT